VKEETKRFLEIINRQAEGVAAREAEKVQPQGVGLDPIREQRDQERREKLGELRAREKPGKRPHRARSVFPRVDPS
jgi:hypothetical protein